MNLTTIPAEVPVMTGAGFKPAFEQNNVAVFLASDANYAPYLGVTLASLAAAASPEHNYDVLVLDDGLSGLDRAKLSWITEGKANLSLRFVDLAGLLERFAPKYLYTGGHLSRTSYGRLFAPNIFAAYSRIIYLDCDLTVLTDPAELYYLDLDGHWLAGARDYGIMSFARRRASYAAYCRRELGLTDLSGYINAGVMLLDLEAMRRHNLENAFVAKLKSLHKPRHADQDVINAVARGRIKFLDPAWNVFEWLAGQPDILDGWAFIPAALREEGRESARKPRIIHFSGSGRPWRATETYSKMDYLFWRYARQTPYYEFLLIHSTPDFDHFKNAFRARKNIWKYCRYRLAAALTWGRLKRRYQEKAARLERWIKRNRRLMT